MADNLVIDEGTSAKSARTDEVTANVHVPFVKLMDGTTDGTTVAAVGANGLACDVKNASIAGTAGTANAGVLSVQGIASMTPVQVTVNSITAGDTNIGNVDVVTVPALVAGSALIGKVGIDQATANANEVVLKAGTASIGKLTDDQKMDLNKIAGASVPVSSGTEATCMRVTLPTDGTGQVKLAASTAAIGKLAANDGVDIGNVDVASLPARAVTNEIQWSHYSNEFTTTQTSTDLVALSGTTKFYIGRLTIGTGGTTAGLVTVYFGTGAYAAGTNKTVFRANMIPSATASPGAIIGNGAAPFIISAAGDALKITTSAGITVYVQVDYIRV